MVCVTGVSPLDPVGCRTGVGSAKAGPSERDKIRACKYLKPVCETVCRISGGPRIRDSQDNGIADVFN